MSFMPQQPAPNRPAGYDPRTGRIYEAPYYDPTADILRGLQGPRGGVYMGRYIPPGTTPNLQDLMTRLPIDIPEEGYGLGPSLDPMMLKQNMGGLTGGPASLQDAMRKYFIGASRAATDFEKQKRAGRNNPR